MTRAAALAGIVMAPPSRSWPPATPGPRRRSTTSPSTASDYIRWAEDPGRALTREDLALEFATIECSFGEDLRGCPYGMDASAPYLAGRHAHLRRARARDELPAGRVSQDRVYLYQACAARGRSGRRSLAIAGKVRAIDVQARGARGGGAARAARHHVAARRRGGSSR